jgi:hypothetical protein
LGSGPQWPGWSSLGAPANCNILSIPKDEKPDPEIKIYPNPSSDWAIIQTNSFQKNAYLSISDINGREVFDSQITLPRIQIDISHFPVGIYFARVISKCGVQAGKIIKW